MSNEQAKAIQIRDALKLAMEICDAVPSRAQHSDNYQLACIGELVNARPDGTHGYAVIRDALEAAESATAAPIAAGVAPEDLSDAQKQTVECMDSWAIAQSLPSYSQLYSLPEQYSDMLRKICFEYSAGGYNSEGLMLPAVADAKIRSVISDVGRAVAPAHPIAAQEVAR